MNPEKKHHLIRSERGNAILMSIGFVALISALLVVNMGSNQNFLNQLFYQSDAVERSKLLNTTIGLLNEQQVCQSIFPQSFDTPAGIHNVTASQLASLPGRVGERVQAALQNFNDFELKSIELQQPTTFTSPEGIDFKQYQALITVGPKPDITATSKGFTRTFGLRDDKGALNKEENIFLVTGTNDRCFFHRDLGNPNSAGIAAVPKTCEALGGVYANAQCNLREMGLDNNGVLQPGTVISNRSNLADGLCQMELTALRKIGPHLISKNNKDSYGWTSLCEKPQWAGCRADDNPASSQLFRPGHAKTDRIWSGNMKELGKQISARAKPTVDRRVARAVPTGISSPGWDSTNPNFKSTNQYTLGLANILGGAALFSLIKGNFSDFANIVAMNLVWGPVIGGLMIVFGPKCNKAELDADKRCVQGYFEIERMRYRTERIRYTWRGPRCSWNGWKNVDPVIDEDGIVAEVRKKGSNPSQTLTLETNSGIAPEDLAELTAEVNRIQSLSELIQMAAGFQTEGAERVELPPVLMNLINARETILLEELKKEVEGVVNRGSLAELQSMNRTLENIQESARATRYPNSAFIQTELSSLNRSVESAIQQATSPQPGAPPAPAASTGP